MVRKLQTDVFITQRILQFIKYAFKFGNKYGLHPMAWDNFLQRAENGPKFQQNVWKLNICISVPNILFILFRCAENIRKDDVGPEMVYFLFKASLGALAIFLHWKLYWIQDEIVSYVNKSIDLATYLEDEFTSQQNASTSMLTIGMETLLRLVYYGFSVGGPVAIVMVGIVAPGSPEQLSSLVFDATSKNGIVNTLALLLTIIISAHTVVLYCTSIMVVTTASISGGLPVLATLFELSEKKHQRTLRRMRTPKAILMTYQALRVIINIWNNTFGASIVPTFKLMASFLTVICTYAAIRIQGRQAFPIGVMGSAGLAVMFAGFSVLAEIESQSGHLISEWKYGRHLAGNSYELQSLKSLPRIKCLVASMYFVDKQMNGILHILRTKLGEGAKGVDDLC